jgi:hypothetical protein
MSMPTLVMLPWRRMTLKRLRKSYRIAMKLAGDNVEIAFWSALTLASKGRVDQALPIFRKVFSANGNWVDVSKRLPKAGTTISDDPAGRALLKRILKETGQT